MSTPYRRANLLANRLGLRLQAAFAPDSAPTYLLTQIETGEQLAVADGYPRLFRLLARYEARQHRRATRLGVGKVS